MWEIGVRAFVFVLAKRASDWRIAKILVQVYLSSVMAPFQKPTFDSERTLTSSSLALLRPMELSRMCITPDASLFGTGGGFLTGREAGSVQIDGALTQFCALVASRFWLFP